jgi:predicted transcriptional regulator
MEKSYIERMVERVSWFSPVDYEIFLFYEEHDILASAKVVAANIDYDRQYVNKRLRKLEDSGLFESEDGLYRLSDEGRKFLDGRLSVDQVEALG